MSCSDDDAEHPEHMNEMAAPILTHAFTLPFPMYHTQKELLDHLNRVLYSGNSHVYQGSYASAVPVVAAEVPTGCGKTLVLLVALLNFIEFIKRLRQKSIAAAERFFIQGKVSSLRDTSATAPTSTADESVPQKNYDLFDNSHEEWCGLPAAFINHFEALRAAGGGGSAKAGKPLSAPSKKHSIKNTQFLFSNTADGEGGYKFLSTLHDEYATPIVSVFYATRTHAQIKQIVGELEKVVPCAGSAPEHNNNHIRMNVMGSRTRLCIQRNINQAHRRAGTSGAVPGAAGAPMTSIENNNNNLGEACDKLVSLNLCPFVYSYSELMHLALNGAIPRNRSNHNTSDNKGNTQEGTQNTSTSRKQKPYFNNAFDIEDLVAEGQHRHSCPYYCSRDLIFYSDITFSSYAYLLDPIIRHESKIEKVLQSHIPTTTSACRSSSARGGKRKGKKTKPSKLHASVFVFDEGHHVADYCRESLSTSSSCSVLSLLLILKELLPLLPLPNSSPKDGGQSAPTGFVLHYSRQLQLNDIFTLGDIFMFLFLCVSTMLDYMLEKSNAEARNTQAVCSTAELAHRLREAFESFSHTRWNFTEEETHPGKELPRNEKKSWVGLFKYTYSIIFSLGVTFNPFALSVFTISQVKKLLLILRFLLQKPDSFALCVKPVEHTEEQTGVGSARGNVNHGSNGQYDSSRELVMDWMAVRRTIIQVQTDNNYMHNQQHDNTSSFSTTQLNEFDAYLSRRYGQYFYMGADAESFKGYTLRGPDGAQVTGGGALRLLFFDIKCLDASLAFHYLIRNSAYRVIIASGTLAPFSELLLSELRLHECGTHRPSETHQTAAQSESLACHIYQGGHVVPDSQYRVFTLATMERTGGGGAGQENPAVPVYCNFQNLSSEEYLSDLMRTVIKYIAGVFFPSDKNDESRGVLVFAPNYGLLSRMHAIVRRMLMEVSALPSAASRRGGVNRTEQLVDPLVAKHIRLFAEPRSASEMEAVFDSYRSALRRRRVNQDGADVCVFFAVYRGKLSEGVNFTGNMSRVVVNVGIPFLNYHQWDVQALRQFHSRHHVPTRERRQRRTTPAGGWEAAAPTVDWYTAEAVRAVNQASGRLLRNREDYGVILLLDERYSWDAGRGGGGGEESLGGRHEDPPPPNKYVRNLSGWCRQSLEDTSRIPLSSEDAATGQEALPGTLAHAVRGSREFFSEMHRRFADGDRVAKRTDSEQDTAEVGPPLVRRRLDFAASQTATSLPMESSPSTSTSLSSLPPQTPQAPSRRRQARWLRTTALKLLWEGETDDAVPHDATGTITLAALQAGVEVLLDEQDSV